MGQLTERWETLRHHPTQHAAWASRSRFVVIAAGRRSGKTELAKRKLILRAMASRRHDARFFAAAPTRDQAKDLFWEDLKLMIPPRFVAGISESHLTIRLIHGPRIVVVGLDKPQRMEGRPWDGGVVDEVADCKPTVWQAHIRPALSDRQGWCWFIGVPEGRNHFYKLYRRHREGKPGWESFHWVSADVLASEEIEAAMEDMDEDLFAQEYEASFVAFRGRAYRRFVEGTHCAPVFRLYDPRRPLVFCLDFNVEPGAAVVLQEARLPSGLAGTIVIGEVSIPFDSDTEAVCRRLVRDWQGHQGVVYLYGDATGGHRKTSGLQGSDWTIARRMLSAAFPRVVMRVPKSNPPPRDCMNAVNARLLSRSGKVRLLVDPTQAPETVMDLEGVRLLEGGSGEINKKGDPERTHWADGLGYYLAKRFPAGRGRPRPAGRRPVEHAA